MWVYKYIYTKQQEREREAGGFLAHIVPLKPFCSFSSLSLSLDFHPHLFFCWKEKEDEAVTRSQSHLSHSIPKSKKIPSFLFTSKDFLAAAGAESNINLASLPLLICFDCIPQPKVKGRVVVRTTNNLKKKRGRRKEFV